jgi:hypothetical protein
MKPSSLTPCVAAAAFGLGLFMSSDIAVATSKALSNALFYGGILLIWISGNMFEVARREKTPAKS